MSHRTTIAGVSVAAAAAIGSAVVIGSHGTSHAAALPTVSAGTVRATTATVSGKTESILTDGHGAPLYYYAPDSPGTSRVSGAVAALWPAVTSTATPTATGLGGRLSVVRDSHGSQVAYNGHLLYTFVSDRPGIVTGQGVQNFFVATPKLAASGGSTSSGNTMGTGPYGGY